MIQGFLFLLMVFLMLPAGAQTGAVSGSYFNANYDPGYKDQGESLLGQFQFSALPEHHFQMGLTLTERTYTGGVKFYKQSYLAGDTWASKACACYVEASVEDAGSTPVGAQAVYAFTPHTTYFTHWDLGLGFRQASYQTGNIFILNPQILYLSEGSWILGHVSWLFDDKGTHHAWREFVRWSEPKEYKIEAGISGGENREDIGIIDQFTSYSINVSKIWQGRYGLGFQAERYEGNLRKGNMFQVDLQWIW